MSDPNNLYRSFNPKFTHYSSDGFGRDSYIHYNNGGLIHDGAKLNLISHRVLVPNKRTFYANKPETPTFRYYSDGTGRDSYVLF